MLLRDIIWHIRIKFATPKYRTRIIKGSTNSIKIGNNCEVYNNVTFGSEPYLIEIGDYVRIGPNVNFFTHDGGIWVLRNNGMLKNADSFGKIKIGSNVHIGTNATIMPGVTIGDNVVIGVGAVVTRNIPSNSVAVGVPAKVIKSLDEYFEKHKNSVDYTKNLSAKDKKKYLCEKYQK